MLLTSDPHAWLRPYFAALAQDHTFARLAPSMRFAALCDAVARDHPAKAAQMREWSPAAQEGTLRWMRSAITQSGAALRVLLDRRGEGLQRHGPLKIERAQRHDGVISSVA